jgi:hypothetical protein
MSFLRRTCISTVLVVMFGVITWGCDNDKSSNTQDSGVTPDAATDAGVDGGGETVEILVVEGDYDDPGLEPIADALVALDDEDGLRAEVYTDSTGVAIFQNVAWMDGTISVTTHKPGYQITSEANVARDDGRLDGPDASLTVPLEASRTLTNKIEVQVDATRLSGSHYLLVSSLEAPYLSQEVAPPWSIQVDGAAPFTVVGLEFSSSGVSVSSRGISQTFFGWLTADHPGSTGTVTLPLDFTDTSDATHTVQGSFDIPARSGSILHTDAWGYVAVSTLESELRAGLGFPSVTDVNAAGDRVDYTLEWVEPPNAGEIYTQYSLQYFDGRWAWDSVPGYPVAGHQDVSFLDVPEWVTPPTLRDGHPLGVDMEWEIFDSDVVVMLFVIRDDDYIWTVNFGKEATHGAIPIPPSNVDSASYLGTSALKGHIFVYDEQTDNFFYERGASNWLWVDPR